MGIEVIATQSWDDMISENLQKESYSIRRAYSQHMSVAIMVMVTLTLLTTFVPRVFPPSSPRITRPSAINSTNLFYIEKVSLKPTVAAPVK